MGSIFRLEFDYANEATYLVNFDLWFPALFLWMMLAFASLSIMLHTSGSMPSASDLLVAALNFFTKVLVVLSWYLFLNLLVSLLLILFSADL